MTKSELVRALTNGFCADRESITDAMAYACNMLRASGADDIAIFTALGVLTNTIANEIQASED